jgi:hypothetical protein
MTAHSQSIARAREHQRRERRALLVSAWNAQDSDLFNRLVLQFTKDDPHVIISWAHDEALARCKAGA